MARNFVIVTKNKAAIFFISYAWQRDGGDKKLNRERRIVFFHLPAVTYLFFALL